MAQTLDWVVHFVDPTGVPRKAVAKGEDAEGAVAALGVPLSRVKRVSRPLFAGFRGNKKQLAMDDQAIYLTLLAAVASAGLKSPGECLDDIIKDQKKLAGKKEEASRRPLLSEKLEVLGFDPTIVTLAQIGEESGEADKLVLEGANSLIRLRQIISEINKGFIPGAIVALVGISVVASVPMIAREPLHEVIGIKDMQVDFNFLTSILVVMGDFYVDYWWTIPAIVVGIILLRKPIWAFLRKHRPFSMFVDFTGLRRALRFVASYRALARAGVDPLRSVQMLESNAVPGDKKSYTSLRLAISGGHSLSESFQKDDAWPELLRMAMSGYDQAKRDQRENIFNNLVPLIDSRLMSIAGRASRVLQFTGMIVAVLSVVMLFGGLVLPLMGASPSIPGIDK